MKVLLRQYGSECYVWKEANYVGGKMRVDANPIHEIDIVSIMDDNRNEYVKCSFCGEIIKNDEHEIEKHRNKCKTSEACFTCGRMRKGDVLSISEKFVKVEDGKYIIKTDQSAKLYCSNGYSSSPDIDSEAARESCRYAPCATARIDAVEDIFTRNPGVFDDIITGDRILEAGYREEYSYISGNNRYYALTGRTKIWAIVNKMNIVDQFRIEMKNRTHYVYYSKKYNEFYTTSYDGMYTVWDGSRYMADSTVTSIKRKIAKLYN